MAMRALIKCMRCAFIYPGPGSEISHIGKIVWLKTRHHRGHCSSHTPIFRFAMGKQMTVHELDSMQWVGGRVDRGRCSWVDGVPYTAAR